MTANKKATVPNSSIGVDVEQPLTKKHNKIMAETAELYNRQATNYESTFVSKTDENELQTITMEELFDTTFSPRVPIVDGLILMEPISLSEHRK